MKGTLRLLMMLAVTLAVMACGVLLLGRLGWWLSPADDVSLDQIKRLPVPDRHPKGGKVHGVARWAADRERTFGEAPMLAQRVKAGRLPPVGQRLPNQPRVIVPPQEAGRHLYGGNWRRLATGPEDIGIIRFKIAYDGLVRWGAMGRKILPNLAELPEITDGGRVYTFRLIEGVRWSDGHPYTADDVMFWYQDVLQNPELTAVVPRGLRRGGQTVEVRKLGQYAVQFRFKEVHGLFLQALASDLDWVMSDYPAHYLKRFHPSHVDRRELSRLARLEGFDFWYQLFQRKRDWSNPECPRLTPWVVAKPPPARPIVFERNPYYWKVDPKGNQLPYIDTMTFDIFNIETINMKLINGDAGPQARHVKFANYPLLMENSPSHGYRVRHWIDANGGTHIMAVNLNQKDEVLRKIVADRRFRKALSHAIDRSDLNETGFLGMGQPRQVCPPPTSPYYDKEYERECIEYDVNKANHLLDAMGLDRRNADGVRLRPDGKPLTLTIDTPGVFIDPRVIELVARYWTAVGVKTEMRILARQLFYTRKRASLHDVGVWGGADEMVPVIDPRWFFPFSEESIFGVGYSQWYRTAGKRGPQPPESIRRCMELYSRIETTPDPAEQVALFKRILDLNRENLWVIGTIGNLPIIMVVPDTFRNVPEVAISGNIFRTPGNTACECYAIVAD